MERPTDPDGIDSHDTYAHYGLAMYAAQCVERQIVILAPMLLGMHPAATSRQQLDQLWERMFGQTMGRTLREFERSVGLPRGFEDRLERALAVRNWLAHDYFWERAAGFLTPEGRQRMRDELSDAATFLHDLDAELVQLGRAWREGVGITDQVLDAEMRKLLSSPAGVSSVAASASYMPGCAPGTLCGPAACEIPAPTVASAWPAGHHAGADPLSHRATLPGRP